MPRVKRGVTARARHKKVLQQARGFRGRRGNVYRVAKQAVMKAGQYAYRDRRNKKRVIRSLWIARISAAGDPASLENAKARFLGKSGELSGFQATLRSLSPEERKVAGAAFNVAKVKIEAALEARRRELGDAKLAARLSGEALDVTLPARSMQDTFYVDLKDKDGLPLVLRTHTSPMQVRYARMHKPPIKVIAPGRTYRVDSDATHSPMFHQGEGLWIDENISFADLKGVYTDFLRRFFENDDLQVRFRPSFFPFTEPSAEIDMAFTTGANRGKWLEISGAGQVHPNVVRNYGLDPEKYIGFA